MDKCLNLFKDHSWLTLSDGTYLKIVIFFTKITKNSLIKFQEFQLDITDIMFAKQQQKNPFKSKIDAVNVAEISSMSDSMTYPQVMNKSGMVYVSGTDESAMELAGGDDSVLT